MSDAPAARPARIAAIVLAAGRSTRFPTPSAPHAFKLTAPIGGRPLVRATVASILAAKRLAEVHVVLGHRAGDVREALAGLPVEFTNNPRFAAGMGASIAAGVAALPAQTDAVVIALGDQPLDDHTILDRIVDRYLTGGASIVRPVYAGIPGNPVLFDAVHFPALRGLDADAGARSLIAASGGSVAHIVFDAPPPPDYDTAADLARRRRG